VERIELAKKKKKLFKNLFFLVAVRNHVDVDGKGVTAAPALRGAERKVSVAADGVPQKIDPERAAQELASGAAHHCERAIVTDQVPAEIDGSERCVRCALACGPDQSLTRATARTMVPQGNARDGGACRQLTRDRDAPVIPKGRTRAAREVGSRCACRGGSGIDGLWIGH
jgi:hypothetical protein